MGQRPNQDQETSLLNYSVKIDGSALPDEVQLAGIQVSSSLYKISTAKIEIFDGDIASGEFKTIEDESYEPGKEVEINLGYQSDDKQIFKGIIVKHSVKISSTKGSKIILECAHKAIKLTGQRKFKYFFDQKDSDIMNALCGSVAKDIGSTNITHETVIQHNVTDWDFLITRAQANQMVVYTAEDKIYAKKPEQGSSDVDLVFGEDIIDLDLALDGRSQIKQLKTQAWDPKSQDVKTGNSQEPNFENIGSGYKGDKLAGDIGYEPSEMHSTGTMDQDELTEWAKSALILSRLSRIRGTVTCQGTAELKVGSMVNLSSLGKYYDGDAYIAGVHHDARDGNWTSEIELGIAPDLFINLKKDIQLPLADGLFPGVNGLFIGKVLQLDQDPEGEHRIKVNLPMVDGVTGDGVWARVSQIMASNDFGSFFLPEIDDEVIVGAVGGDLRFPVVLGHLYSSSRKAPGEFRNSDDNFDKGWKTKSEMLFHFNDEDKIIKIETPAKNYITLDEKDQKIEIKDQNGNRITMDRQGIEMYAQGDFKVEATGSVDIKGAMNAKMHNSAGGKVDLTSGNTTLSGATTDVKATGMMNLNATGVANLKGSIVNIN